MIIEFSFFLLFVRAMSSSSNKEQFLNQFESIVKGIVDNKDRVSFALNFIAYWWTQEVAPKFGMNEVYKGQISTVKR